MRSGYRKAVITLLFVASCGADGYGSGSDYGDDEDSQDEEGSTSRDAGATGASVRDGGTIKPDAGAWDAGGGGVGAGDDVGDDDDDDGASTADAGADAGGDAGGDGCETLTYQSFGRQFITDYCVSCHGGTAPRGGFKLDTLAAVNARKTGVKTQVLSGGMPMGNKRPTDAERARLGQWIDCGPK